MGGRLRRKTACEAFWRKHIVCCRNQSNQVVSIETRNTRIDLSTNWVDSNQIEKSPGVSSPNHFRYLGLRWCWTIWDRQFLVASTNRGVQKVYMCFGVDLLVYCLKTQRRYILLEAVQRSGVDDICTINEQASSTSTFCSISAISIVVVFNYLDFLRNSIALGIS